MTYLVLQMLLCLLIAFVLGWLLGWWLTRRGAQERVERLEEKWRGRLEACRERSAAKDADLEVCREQSAAKDGDLEACREALDACRQELEKQPADETEPESAPEPAESSVAEEVDEAGEGAADAVIAPLAAMPADEEPFEEDDLTKVEGIGPKIAGLLNDRGIYTWAQLAATEVSFLQSVLDDAGPRYRVHDPATWPRQAELAAAGAWDELEELQDRLQGGREV